MSYYGWKPYVPVAKRREKAEKAAAKATKKGAVLSPVVGGRGAIAKTFWGKAWCDNLERYSDYANRLPRGRTYVRNGSVIDLIVAEGKVHAQVMGSSLYKVAVSVATVPEKHWQAIGADCAGSIDSLVELLQGRMSKGVMERICAPKTGLFPAPHEITLDCSCPDWASMCKHVAAVLYGIGARLDAQPELLFRLRGVDAKDLVAQAGAGTPKASRGLAKGKVLDVTSLADVFGIEMAEAPAATAAPAKKARGKATTAAAKPPAKTGAPKEPAGGKKTAPSKKPLAPKATEVGKKATTPKKPPEPKKAVVARKTATPKAPPAPVKAPVAKKTAASKNPTTPRKTATKRKTVAASPTPATPAPKRAPRKAKKP
ncbi:MAG: SWIM zinc finger family protein [Rhodocyclaceae bacterium]|nr:SWIM zinc finger family protein [Rhodocyclaceae bacterium]